MKYDLIGKRFHNFIVIKKHGRRKFSDGAFGIEWECSCDCGKSFIALTGAICSKRNRKRSCGCLNYRSSTPHRNTKQDPKISSYNHLVNSYKQRAKYMNILWNLTNEQTIQLFKANCKYCGIQPSNTYNAYMTKAGKRSSKNIERVDSAWIQYNGIDRINNNLGYDFNNCNTCCKTCNLAKHTMNLKDFSNWISRLVKYQNENSLHK